jgi:hypothetical protein
MTTSVPSKSPTTAAFFAQAAISFAISGTAVLIGIVFMPVDPWVRAFLGIGVLYTISSAFTLAKCVRDRQDESSVATRVDRARVDKLIAEHDPFRVDAP